MTASRAEILGRHPDREQILAGMSDTQMAAMYADWSFHARPEQVAPDWLWRWWAAVTGRGFGKNRMGSEWCCDRAEQFAKANARHLMGLMNATYGDVKAVQIGGESGIEAVALRRGHILDIGRTALEGRLRVWTANGWHDTTIEVHTADRPDRARGRNFHTLWADEAGKWQHKEDSEGGTAFTNADLGLRALCPPGLSPRGAVTTTPKAIKLVRDLIAGEYGPTAITRGSMYDNLVNLDPSFVAAVRQRYDGSRLGAQEIHGLLLENVEGALWSGARIEATRIKVLSIDPSVDDIYALLPPLHRVVVGVDPFGGGKRGTCGIVVCGVGWLNGVPHLYVLEDCSEATPSDEWSATAIRAYYRWRASAIVFETNYGGDMGPGLVRLQDTNVVCEVVTATRGKAVRAEPIAALWSPQQSRGHYVGWHPELEEQVTTWVPGDESPDRLDAKVWCGHALMPDLGAIEQTRAYGSSVAEARL